MASNFDEFGSHYDDSSFWETAKVSVARLSRGTLKLVLKLYYCLSDDDTPAWAKSAIISVLGYFVFPFDAIPDIAPGAGYTDDVGVLSTASLIVALHIKPEHDETAEGKLTEWFG